MSGSIQSRLVNKNGISSTVWNAIENAHRSNTEVVYAGRRYRALSISRLFLADGETALATLSLVTEYR